MRLASDEGDRERLSSWPLLVELRPRLLAPSKRFDALPELMCCRRVSMELRAVEPRLECSDEKAAALCEVGSDGVLAAVSRARFVCDENKTMNGWDESRN